MARTTINQTARGATSSEMTTLQVMILSGIGGAAISLGSFPDLLKGDVAFFVAADSVQLLGFAIRIIGGALLGAFWGYLHCPESKPIKAFQLGLIAPAAIASMVFSNIDATDGKTTQPAPPAIEESAVHGDLRLDARPGLFSLIGSAHADGLSDTVILRPDSPQDSFLDRLIKGIVGK
ncbi:hypothetical protein [Breoghania sp. L-A4]|uniref:hypothetical protein n=1 Tax=Breoghania sp. L-A4 TaxID=2304600 RepID=UPI000E360C99|nr:hypothetical protein [Breoghania sp. L-A4]AXS42108.1 hypothetical protein D1F64_21530 [Breoghania sp. L-A4]